ncbi:MAG: hypothetical protein HKL80_02100 [Acidimicrobiales bacterium]|nr:hypothetical protein [Acidimicrobiales bacterium]
MSCVSSQSCAAADGMGQVLFFNGTSWSAPYVADVSSALTSISCATSTQCVAVAFDGKSYLFNGPGTPIATEVITPPADGPLSISCPEIYVCIAVDANGSAFRWDGSSWSNPDQISTSPVTSISCPISSWCLAGDGAGDTYTWEGNSWSSPDSIDSLGGGISAVSCSSSATCLAVDRKGMGYDYVGLATVASISPSSGPLSGGTSVTINGSGFTGATSVQFGSLSAIFSVTSDGVITATVPASTTPGVLPVTVTTPNGTSTLTSISGYLYVNAGSLHSVTSTRVCDTRSGATDPSTYQGQTLGPGGLLDVAVAGSAPGLIPLSASAVVANVTAVGPTTSGFLTIWPAGLGMPTASSVNFSAGEIAVANLIEIPVGQGGAISIFNSTGNTDVLVDIVGWVGSASGGTLFNSLPPTRVIDTRVPSLVPTVSPGSSINVQMEGVSGIPSSGVAAVAVNVTATDIYSPGGYLVAYATGAPKPDTSTLNFVENRAVANRAIVDLSLSGSMTITDFGVAADIVVDVTGYFSSTGYLFHPLSPTRIADTRPGSSYQLAGHTLVPGPPSLVQITGYGSDGVPSGAISVVANATVTDTSISGGYLTAFPAGTSRPSTSDLNWADGETVANMIITGLSPTGAIDIAAPIASADAVIDVTGWYG